MQGGMILPPTLYVPTITGRVTTAVKRKVEAIASDSEDENGAGGGSGGGDMEEENIYDGIKRLYSEETTAVGG